MAAPKGSKKFFNSLTGEVVIRLESPGPLWIHGIPSNHVNAKGKLVWHNPLTGEHIRRESYPGEPWVRGWSPERAYSCGNGNRGRKQTNEEVDKRIESLTRRHRETGLSKKEVERAEKVSIKQRGKTTPQEVREKISSTLKGRKTGYNPSRCKAVSERCGCDSLYLLKISTPCGAVFGKWGSTRAGESRWGPLISRGWEIEVLFLIFVGDKAPQLEEWVGSLLSPFPADLGEVSFGGYTETFELSRETLNLLSEIENELEKNSPS
jgi:hypothetical protein